jgi:hypothetical protein
MRCARLVSSFVQKQRNLDELFVCAVLRPPPPEMHACIALSSIAQQPRGSWRAVPTHQGVQCLYGC